MKVQIQISGPVGSRKTRMAVLIQRYLESLGASVNLQKADPELDEKLEMTDEALAEKLTGVEVFITEMQTARSKE